MGDITFTFGQRGGFLFESASERRAQQLPPALTALFSLKKIKSIRNCVLGSGSSFFVSYEGTDDLDHMYCEGLPETLKKWIYEKDSSGNYARDFTKCRLVLGPYNASYFATDGTAYQWAGLPEDLRKAIEEYRDPSGGWRTTPRIVALGAHDNFVVVTEGDGASWCLSHYKELDGFFDAFKEMEKGISLVQDICLDPYRFNNFVLVGGNGHVQSGSVPPHAQTSMTEMQAVVKSDTEKSIQQMQELERLQQLQQLQRTLQMRQAQAENAALQAQLARLRRYQRLNTAINAFNALSLGASVLGSGAGYASGYGGFGFDPSAFWQPINDAASMGIQ